MGEEKACTLSQSLTVPAGVTEDSREADGGSNSLRALQNREQPKQDHEAAPAGASAMNEMDHTNFLASRFQPSLLEQEPSTVPPPIAGSDCGKKPKKISKPREARSKGTCTKAVKPAAKAAVASEERASDIPNPISPTEQRGLPAVAETPTRLEQEANEWRGQVDRLEKAVEVLEREKAGLIAHCSRIEEQYDETRRRANGLFLENRRLRSFPPKENESGLINDFKELSADVAQWCNWISRVGDGPSCTAQDLRRSLGDSFDLPTGKQLTPALLASSASKICQALVVRVLTGRIFCNELRDPGDWHDFWTSREEAEHLGFLEMRVAASGLCSLEALADHWLTDAGIGLEEFNKWRALTVRSLTESPGDNQPRVDSLVTEIFSALTRLCPSLEKSPQAPKMKEELKEEIVERAIDLSRGLRRQRSQLEVCIPEPNSRVAANTTNTTHDPSLVETLVSRRRPKMRIVTWPAMIRYTDLDGGPIETVSVLAKCETWSIVLED